MWSLTSCSQSWVELLQIHSWDERSSELIRKNVDRLITDSSAYKWCALGFLLPLFLSVRQLRPLGAWHCLDCSVVRSAATLHKFTLHKFSQTQESKGQNLLFLLQKAQYCLFSCFMGLKQQTREHHKVHVGQQQTLFLSTDAHVV